jgi:hypothetical protein
MMSQDDSRHLEKRYIEAAEECIELARATPHEGTRVGLLTLAQKWLHLAHYRLENRSFLAALQVFNDSRSEIETCMEVENQIGKIAAEIKKIARH